MDDKTIPQTTQVGANVVSQRSIVEFVDDNKKTILITLSTLLVLSILLLFLSLNNQDKIREFCTSQNLTHEFNSNHCWRNSNVVGRMDYAVIKEDGEYKLNWIPPKGRETEGVDETRSSK